MKRTTRHAASSRGRSIAAPDTIVAVSSAAGAAARGIIRLSGPGAASLAAELGVPPSHGTPNYSASVCRLSLGENWPPLPTISYLMRAPTSYTREDVVELHTVGAPSLLRALLSRLLERGARLAAPGEFTRRAFLNGRIDLAQAEAVQQVIRARDDEEHRLALEQLRGGWSARVETWRRRLIRILAQVELETDFSDQDVPIHAAAEVGEEIRALGEEIAAAIAAGRPGRVREEAPRVLLAGLPNAGKSSLFNALLRRERALVSPRPGTTRDLLEAALELGGRRLILCDSPGVGAAAEEIERLAAERVEAAARAADLVLLVVDGSRSWDAELAELLARADPSRSLVAVTKADLPQRGAAEAARAALPGAPQIATSIGDGSGLDELASRLRRLVEAGGVGGGASHFLAAARHAAALNKAIGALNAARAAVAEGPELAAFELREALDHLGVIVGATVADDALDAIFAEFCIGK